MKEKKVVKEKQKAILKFIATERIKAGISHYDMGKYLVLSESGYFKIEKGKTKLDIERLLLILEKMDISFLEFAKEIDY